MDYLLDKLYILPGIIIGLSFHEFAHAKVAQLCGDPTAENMGRVTLNPGAHFDPLGLICLLIIGFGWGKPVPVNPYNFNNRRRDELLVSVAGIAMNFLLAVCFMGLTRVCAQVFGYSSSFMAVVLEMMIAVVQINLCLMIFNLIPVPPLDGFNIVTEIFDLNGTRVHEVLYRYGSFILVLLLISGAFDAILAPPVNGLYSLLYNIFF